MTPTEKPLVSTGPHAASVTPHVDVGAVTHQVLLAVKAAPTSGFTIDPWCRCPPRYGHDDYVVSVSGHERRFSPLPTHADIETWVEDNLGPLSVRGHYVGGWASEDNEYCLDISVIVEGREQAVHIGRLNSQESIYHPATDTYLDLTAPTIPAPQLSAAQVGALATEA